MRTNTWKWGLALGLSGVLHAGAAVFVLPGEPEVEIAGGQGGEIALAGTAFTDLSAAGTPSETVEPVTETPVEVTPVAPEVTAAEPIETVETAVAEVPVEPSVTEPIEPAAQESAEVEPAEPKEMVAAMVDIPQPTPRPHYEPPKTQPKEAKAPTRKQPPARKNVQRSAGSGGRDSQDARRGTAEDGRNAANASSGRTARATASGNAAVSNYPGKVVSRLRRALRYPRQAQRERLRGEVHVAFTIAGNGAVSGIRVVRSSGSPVLDQAAVETVHRAAPFPAIPASAGRASWPFTVPLAFVR